jgi:hypothetical protein
MAVLEACARERQVVQMFGYVLAENDSMRGMMVARGYSPVREQDEPGIIRFELPLASVGARGSAPPLEK